MNSVPGLPTELWSIIIRMAAHFPLDIDFTSDDDPWEVTAVFNHKQIMATKLSLMLVSRQFNGIVREFLFEFVYISTMQLSMSIASQKEWDRNRPLRLVHDMWRNALTKKLHPGYSPVPTRPTNVLDLSRRANVNIRYLFVEERGGCHLADYTFSVANFLKSDCCSNLVGLFIAGDSDKDEPPFAYTVIKAIPSRLKFLSWNRPDKEQEAAPLLARYTSLRTEGTSGVTTSPKLTHFSLTRQTWNGRGVHHLQYLGGWNIPPLTPPTFAFGTSDEPSRTVYPMLRLFEPIECLQLHLHVLAWHSTEVSIGVNMIAEPTLQCHAHIIISHDLPNSFAFTPMLVQQILQIHDRNSFPKMKTVDVLGVASCRTFPSQLIGVKELQVLLRNVSHSLAMLGVEIRVVS